MKQKRSEAVWSTHSVATLMYLIPHVDLPQLGAAPLRCCSAAAASLEELCVTSSLMVDRSWHAASPYADIHVWFIHPTGSRGYCSPIWMPEFFFQVWKFKKNYFSKVKVTISFVIVLATLLHLVFSKLI